MTEKNEIIFEGEYDFLAPSYSKEIKYGGEIYPTAEHAFWGYVCENKELRKIITDNLLPPNELRYIVRNLPIKKKQDYHYKIMKEIQEIKFSDPVFSDCLLRTGEAKLVYANIHNDVYFGVNATDRQGINMLGTILEEIRDEKVANNAGWK